jgi:CheY-like chemotaxis protein
MKVLCVIKDRAELMRVIAAVRDGGYEVISTTSEREARERLATTSPQLILVDAALPFPDLLNLVRHIRSIRARPYAYILLLVTSISEDELQVAYETGCDGDLRKPSSPALLRARLAAAARTLGLEAVRRAPVPAKPAPNPPSDDGAARSPLDAVSRSSTWQQMGDEIAAVAGTFLTLPVSCASADSGASSIDLASGIVLANVEQELEVRVALSTDHTSGGALAARLFGEGAPDLQADMLNELANMAMGALKAAFGRDALPFTGSLPAAIAPEALAEFGAACQRQQTFALVAEGARISVRVGIISRKNVVVAVAALREGMVIAKDVFNDEGVLLLTAGTRLSSSTADRLRAMLESRRSVEVAA